MAKVAVVILNYNGRKYLEMFLGGVVQHSPAAEVIVADNCSTDDSVAYIREHHPTVRILQMKENRGFSGGYNLALKEVDSNYYVILNSDVEVTPGWIKPVINYMDTHPDVAACQPKLLDWHQKTRFEYAGAAGGFIDPLGYPFCRGRIFQVLEEDRGQYDDISDIFWASGACLFIRSRIFHEVQGFDEDYFAHMEEIDLCWRIRLTGHRICYLPSSTVYHVGGGTLPKGNPRKTYLNFRNSLATLYKNSSSTGLFWKLPARLVLDMVAAIKFLFTDGLSSLVAVWKANRDFYVHIGRFRKKRKAIAHIRKNKVRLSYRQLLVVDFYLKGKRKFSELKIH